MSDRTPWFERRFNFDFPVGHYQDILDRVRGTPVRLQSHVDALSDDVLSMRDGSTWSIKENVGHLADLEPLWAGRVDDILGRIVVMREADLSNTKTREANHNAASIGDLMASFQALRRKLIALLDGLDAKTFAFAAVHPRLRVEMRLVDLCLFIAEHDDYHLARVYELSRRFREAGSVQENG
jgi:uncharacterized damage-inducible protein DinB